MSAVYSEKRAWAWIGSDAWKNRDLKILQSKTSVTVVDAPSGIRITQYQVLPEGRGKAKRWLTAELAQRVRGFCVHDLPPPETDVHEL